MSDPFAAFDRAVDEHSEHAASSLDTGLGPLLNLVTRRTLRDRLTRPARPKLWRWHGLVGEYELAYLHGMGGLSKSLLAQALVAARVPRHRPCGFLLGRPVSPGRTLYLDAENDDATIDDRLRRLGLKADDSGVAYHRVEAGILGLAQESGLLVDLLRQLIDEAVADLAVLDSWASLWGKDELNHELVQGFFNNLNTVRAETKCAILLLGHDNRAGDFRGLAVVHNSVQARIHLKPTRKSDVKGEDDDDLAGVTDITLRNPKQRGAAMLPRIPFTVAWQPRAVTFTPTGTHAGAVELVVRLLHKTPGQLVPTRALRDQFQLPKNFFERDVVDMLHACGCVRDNEEDPRLSSGWMALLPTVNEVPSVEHSNNRASVNHAVSDLPRNDERNPKDRSTMRVSTFPGFTPPTGVFKPPRGGRVGEAPDGVPSDAPGRLLDADEYADRDRAGSPE